MSGPELPTVTIPEAPAGDGALNSDFFDCEFVLADPEGHAWAIGLTATAAVDFIDGFNMGMGDLGGDSALDVRSDLSPIISEESDTHRPNKSTQDAYDAGGMSSGAPAQLDCPSSQRQLPTLANNIAQELPNRLALDTNSHSPAQSSALSGVPSPLTADRNSSPPCCCLNDLVRVVQQLDDDEFRITTMSLDQVLQLQKWLVFQCCKPFDCPQCLDLPTVDTLRLIVCDRLTEMFECIHLRIKRAGDILVGHSSDSGTQSVSSQSPDSHSAASRDSPHSVRQPPAVAAWPSPAQLFCGSSGRAANKAACNPLMFSDDFRNQYSDEEQVHMIRVLLRLQIRNFHNLLLQVERASQGATSQARQAKVKSMLMRLSKAGMDIEGALRVVFRSLSLSRDLSFSAQDQHRHLGAFDVAFSESDHDIR